jgi:hypothetical protein
VVGSDEPEFKTDESVVGSDEQEFKTDESVVGSDEQEFKTDESLVGSDEDEFKSDETEFKTDEPEFKTDESVVGSDEQEFKTDESLVGSDDTVDGSAATAAHLSRGGLPQAEGAKRAVFPLRISAGAQRLGEDRARGCSRGFAPRTLAEREGFEPSVGF